MTEEVSVNDKLVQMLDSLQDGIVKVGDTAVQYAPDVGDALLWVVRLDSAHNIFIGLICLVISCTLISKAKKSFKRHSEISDKEVRTSSEREEQNLHDILQVVFSLGAIPPAGAAFVYLIDFWDWAGMFAPKLKIAKMLVDSVM